MKKELTQEKGLVKFTAVDAVLSGARRAELQATQNQIKALENLKKEIQEDTIIEMTLDRRFKKNRAALKAMELAKKVDSDRKAMRIIRKRKEDLMLKYNAVLETILADFEPDMDLVDKLEALEGLSRQGA